MVVADRDANRQRFDAQEKAVAAALSAAKEAVAKAETAAEKRFEAVNEFRGQLTDQAATFVTRAEYEATRRGDVARVDELKGRVDTSGGRAGGLSAGWAALLGAVGLVVGLATLYAALRR